MLFILQIIDPRRSFMNLLSESFTALSLLDLSLKIPQIFIEVADSLNILFHVDLVLGDLLNIALFVVAQTFNLTCQIHAMIRL